MGFPPVRVDFLSPPLRSQTVPFHFLTVRDGFLAEPDDRLPDPLGFRAEPPDRLAHPHDVNARPDGHGTAARRRSAAAHRLPVAPR